MSAPLTFASQKTPLTAEGMRALGVAWPLFERTLKRVAHCLSPAPDDRDDLMQSAMVELWEIDPTRFAFKDAREIGYVREILVKHMLRVSGVELGGDQRLMAEVGPALSRPSLPGLF